MSEFIPQFTLQRQWGQVGDEILQAAQRVFLSGRYVLGPENEAFEREIQDLLDVRFALACATGTDALHLALRAAGVGPGDVVVTTPFTFFATAGAILLAGARPELVDIDPRTFTMDGAALKERLSAWSGDRLAGIVPVHLYGRMADMDAIGTVAEAYDLPVIEDAAQAFGAWLPAAGGGRRAAGTLGRAGCFSFYPTKNLGAMGEGGLVTTGDDAVIDRLRLLRVHGSRRRYEHEMVGWNARMDELQAAVLRVKLQRAREWVERRQAIAAAYEERLLATGIAALPEGECAGGLGRAPAGVEVILPERTPGHAFHQYIVRARRRDGLRAGLVERQIGTEVYYPIPVHRQPLFAGSGLAAQKFPHAEAAAEEVLGLPMFPELTETEIDRIVEGMVNYYRN